jgi:hypothetical protein
LDGQPYELGSEIGRGLHTLVVKATDSVGNSAQRKIVFLVKTRAWFYILGGGLALAVILSVGVVVTRGKLGRRGRKGIPR